MSDSAGGRWDAVVVGAGPNGLAAAVELGRSGWRTLVLEGEATAGGGCRTRELTLPGFRHDVCAAVHPLGASSPFFAGLPMERHGLRWLHPEVLAASPLEDGSAVLLHRDLEETAAGLGPDAAAWRALLGPLVAHWPDLVRDVLRPLPALPRHPLRAARFAWSALRSADALARSRFRGPRARVLLAGLAAHGGLPLERSPTASFALSLAAAGHASGWPLAAGGSQAIIDALLGCLDDLGGRVVVDRPVRRAADLPPARAYLFDVTPPQLTALAGRRLVGGVRRRYRGFRPGPGVFKVDYALAEPVPWRAGDCRRAGTLHLGGSLEEIAASERAVWRGRTSRRPYVIVVQPTLWDPARAPMGRHTAWAYCHVPFGSREDVLDRLEAQLERFAPGFRDCVLQRHVMPPAALEAYNPNYRGGDISGGAPDLGQTLFRPVPGLHPYRAGVPGWYLCSSSTPPGGAVHGLCGYHAARAVLRDLGREA